MKVVVTAMGKPELHEQLKKEKEIKIIGNDIQYQEGIFEIIEKEKYIHTIIISELISGKLEVQELIKKIKNKNRKIKIIILLEKPKIELEKELKKIGIKEIGYLNRINKKELMEKIENKKDVKELEKENEELKLLLEKNKKENHNPIISILGTSGIGKSIFIHTITRIFPVEKILIIDLDILNKSIQQLFKIERNKNNLEKNIFLKKDKIENYIIKINKKIHILSGQDIFFNKYIENKKIENILYALAEKYDVIFIDTTLEYFLNKNKKIIEMSNYGIFLIEGNMLEIKKVKNIIRIYLEEWEIQSENIKMIINKYTPCSIDEAIIKNIFNEYEIIGKLKYDAHYQMATEKDILCNKKIKKEYQKINEKIIKNVRSKHARA